MVQTNVGNMVEQSRGRREGGVRRFTSMRVEPHAPGSDGPSSVIFAKRRNLQKADESYERIERMYPGYEMRELFSRQTRAGWCQADERAVGKRRRQSGPHLWSDASCNPGPRGGA
jgi:N6-adenosine-specific RNA methylase IME4